MKTLNHFRFTRGIAIIGVAFAFAGCGGGEDAPMTETPTAQVAAFTDWSKREVYLKSEDTTPVATDTVTFNFDGDDNPDAYAELLPTT